jgi:ABC-type bacteriocin/lantibiotic exporter with double-glycine peptidase domain
MIELYKAIWRVTGSRQTLLVVLSVCIAGLAAVPLEYQKNIINGLTEASLTPARLLTLCAAMGGFILLSLALKWLLGYRSSLLGEDVIRLIRNRVGALSGDRGTDREQLGGGTYATMVSAEAEEIGMFTGSAISEPLLQAGTLIVVISYIASTQPILGLIAFSMILPQVAIVLTVQGRVNALIAKRVRILRGATDKLVGPHVDISKLSAEFDEIYESRARIFLWKQSSKFFLSALNGAGLIAILLLGGWQVLAGNTDVGTVVAATAGLLRIQGPTNFLIAFYRQVSATSVKFELLRAAAGQSAANTGQEVGG